MLGSKTTWGIGFDKFSTAMLHLCKFSYELICTLIYLSSSSIQDFLTSGFFISLFLAPTLLHFLIKPLFSLRGYHIMPSSIWTYILRHLREVLGLSRYCWYRVWVKLRVVDTRSWVGISILIKVLNLSIIFGIVKFSIPSHFVIIWWNGVCILI